MHIHVIVRSFVVLVVKSKNATVTFQDNAGCMILPKPKQSFKKTDTNRAVCTERQKTKRQPTQGTDKYTDTQAGRQKYRDSPGSRVPFPALRHCIRVAFFAIGPGCVLKCISFSHSNLPYQFKKSIC